MFGLGTIINTGAIILGGLSGHLFGKALKERHQDSLTLSCGVSVLFIGIAGAMQGMLTIQDGVISSGQTMLVTLCLAVGTLIGEITQPWEPRQQPWQPQQRPWPSRPGPS